jgi:methyl-accepting chemotaxis protein
VATIGVAVADKLRSFAGDNSRPGSKEALAGLLSTKLANSADAPFWAALNFREEFDARPWSSRATSGGAAIARACVPVLYLLPVGITWFHLWRVVSSFRDFVDQQSDANFNILTYWSGGYDRAYSHMTLSTVAIWVVIALFIVAGAQVWANISEQTSRSEIQATLDDLISELSVEGSRIRTISPEQLQKTFQSAANDLKSTIDSIDKSLSASGRLIGTVITAAETLKTSTDALQKTVTDLGASSGPLEEVGDSLKKLAQSVKEGSDSVGRTAAELENVVALIQNKMSPGFRSVSDSISNSVERLGPLVQSFDRSVAAAHEISNMLEDLSKVTSGHEPMLMAIRDVLTPMVEAAEGVQKAVNEIAAAANILKEENDKARQSLGFPD